MTNNIITPLFTIGKVSFISHCNIIESKYVENQWNYFIVNEYNSYGSGWLNEDEIITKIKNLKDDSITTIN